VEQEFQDHIIICGLGATAMQIIEELESYRERSAGTDTIIGEVRLRDYLVIESSKEVIDKTIDKWPNLYYIIGDAADDDILERACIRNAYGIFPVLSSERDNLYITMAARQLNPRIRIVARTADVVNIGKKLFKGGANSVISPNSIGGLRLVSEIARPHVTEFLDEMLRDKNTRLRIAEVGVEGDSMFCGLSLKEAGIPERCGLIIIAMKKRGDRFYTYNPHASSRIEPDDMLVVLGYTDQILQLNMLVKGQPGG
jgi:voltage-gated potassium channel